MYVKTGVFRYMITAWLPELTSSISEATDLPFYRIPNKPKNMSISGRHRVKIRVGRYVCFKNLFE